MIFNESEIPGVFFIELQPRGDARGHLTRTFCKREFSTAGIVSEFVQMNQTFTKEKGTVRGMHFQYPPHAEKKLIRCIRGKVFDVAIDLRSDSPAFLKWVSIELSPENNNMIQIPEGCAHGFQTLEDDCELIYCHTEYYTPEAEGGVRIDDPKFNIRWPIPTTNQSERDKSFSLISSNFTGIRV